MHICVGSLTIIGSDNGLSPHWRQVLIWTNAGILIIRTLRIHFREIFIKIHTFSLTKMHLKMSSVKWRPFCLVLNVLTYCGIVIKCIYALNSQCNSHKSRNLVGMFAIDMYRKMNISYYFKTAILWKIHYNCIHFHQQNWSHSIASSVLNFIIEWMNYCQWADMSVIWDSKIFYTIHPKKLRGIFIICSPHTE